MFFNNFGSTLSHILDYNFFKVEEIRQNIDFISVKVQEVKKKHSDILSAPQADDSKLHFLLKKKLPVLILVLIKNSEPLLILFEKRTHHK